MAATKKSKKERAQEVWTSNEYLKTLLAQIPEEKQAEVFEHLGEHVLRQDEFSRLSDEAKSEKEQTEKTRADLLAERERLNAWYGDATQKYAEMEAKLKAAAGNPPDFDASKYLTKEEAAKLTNEARIQLESQSLVLQEAIDEVKAQHFKTFGEYLTTRELVAHARKIGKPVDAAWQDMVGARLADKQKSDAAKHEADLRAEIEKDVRSKLGPSLVYPTATEPSGTLAGLTPAKDAQFGVKAAIEAIQRGDVKF